MTELEPYADGGVPAVDSWVRVVADVTKLAGYIAPTNFVPAALRDDAPACAAAILYGREIGLPPLTALSSVDMIDGRPSLSAEAMRGLVVAAGHDIRFTEATGQRCTAEGRRAGSERWHSVTWTLDMARSAGLTEKRGAVWSRYPRAMLQARATTELCRMLFADVIHGMPSSEEAADEGGTPAEPPPSKPRRTVTRRTGPTSEVEAAQPDPPPTPDEPAAELAAESDSGFAAPPLPGYDETTGPGAAESPSQPGDPAPGPDPSPEPEAVADPWPEPDPWPETERQAEPEPDNPAPMSNAQRRMMHAIFRQAGFDSNKDRGERLHIARSIVGRDLASSSDLTAAEASRVIDILADVHNRDDAHAVADSMATLHDGGAAPEPANSDDGSGS